MDIRGWPNTSSQEVEWLRQGAEAGRIEAQSLLGQSYLYGFGTLQNFSEAAKWLRRAARGGDAIAQFELSDMYTSGKGVPQDNLSAYAWRNLAAGNLLPSALRDVAVANRNAWSQVLTPYELSQAQRSLEEPQIQTRKPSTLPRTERVLSSGSAFVVSRQGYLLTNEHVIEGCINVELKLEQTVATGRIVARDKSNDFALLEAPLPISSVATFRSGRSVRHGDSVAVIGFPLKGLLAEGPSVTTGAVSALAGPGNDARLIQITAPVQPGNSGGPLLDEAGNVVGVVVSKLNALKVAAITGDIPQNVNFAISARFAQQFLDANGVDYETAQSKLRLTPADVAERGMKFTVSVECYRPG